MDLTPSSTKSRALLATLAVRRGQTVTSDSLVDELWPSLPPDKGKRVLQVRLAEIRKHFADAGPPFELAIASTSAGYRLDLPPEALDTERFVQLVHDGEAHSGRGDMLRTSTVLREALGLWRGAALAGLQVSQFLEMAAAGLEELRLVAVEQRTAAELADGCHARLVGELESLVRAHPLRERLWELLVLALYRSSRQTEALRACATIRRLLADDIGVSPGPGLGTLEAAVLAHDPILDLPPPSKIVIGQDATGAVVDPSLVVPEDPRRCRGAPPVQYVRSPDGVNIAYQVIGEGPDLLFVPGYPSHLDVWWEPWGGRLTERLSEFVRLIILDHRGMGLSDRPPNIGIEQWLEDIELVRAAVGAERPFVLGISAGGSVSTVFTSRNLDRVRGLILYGTRARYLRSDDYPFGLDPGDLDEVLTNVERKWGEGKYFPIACPSAAGNEFLHREYQRYERLAASPAAGASYVRALFQMDVRDTLPQITVPTLVVHAKGDRSDSIEQARFMAARLPLATTVELDSDDHLIWLSDARDELIDAIRTFVLARAADDRADA